MKIKLRDMTFDQYKKWYFKECLNGRQTCKNCPFHKVRCFAENIDYCWVNNKDFYSDKFLDQEIEIEDEKPLMSEEAKIFLEDKTIFLGSEYVAKKCNYLYFYTKNYKVIWCYFLDENNKMFDFLEEGICNNIKKLINREDDILILEERVYLRKIIEPYRSKVESIEKIGSEYLDSDNDFVVIHLVEDSISIPIISDLNFKGMEFEFSYTLEELGL